MVNPAKYAYLAAILVVLFLVAGALSFWANNNSVAINNFEECAAAGRPIMESYPRQCAGPDGRTFVEIIANEPNLPPDTSVIEQPTPTPKPAAACVRGGCSSQLCLSKEDAENMVTTCEYRAEYACYNTARCERQTSGQCGWTQTESLRSCLQNPPAL